ncbi:MAG: hypothetical protein Q4B61_11305 [Bacteroidales bacterium]|nr:hypothetical protein [Bacteroidales bacterium]
MPQAKAIGKGLDTLRMDSVRVDEATTCTAIWFKDSVEVREKYDGVIIEVKKTTQDTWTPFKLESTVRTDTTIELSSLSYNDSFMVRGQYYMLEEGKPVYAPYSDTVYFRIKHPADTVDCGAPVPELTDCSGSGERSEFRLGDRFSANGTSVTIDSIISQKVNGSSLTLTGLGHIPFPILSNFGLKVSFTDVEINCDNQLKRGKVISVYDEKTAAMIDLNNIIGKGSAGNDLGQSDAILNDGGGDVSNLSEGDVILNDDNKVTVKDPEGNEISVGTIIDLSSSSVYSDNTSLNDSKVYIKFSNPDPENIAFDDDQNLRKSSFTLVENYRDFGGGYIIPWVASNPGRKFQLKATLSDNFKSEGYTDVKFVIPASSGKHIELESEADGEGYLVSIPGISTNKQSTVYAIARKSADSPYENVGKLNLCCYTYKTKKIVIVPLVEGITVSADEVKTALEKIYGKLGYTFEVEVDKAHSNGVRKSITLESTVMSEFSSDMKEVINGYKANVDADDSYSYDKSAAYLFLMDKPEGSFAETKGIMPQKQQFGFIFMQGSQSVSSAETHTMAHELGHGLFGLDHVFIKSYGIGEGTTHNLMDYTKNTPDDFLSYHEWSQINSPVMSWSLFNSDEDNMWTTDGHYYLFTYIGMLMGLSYEKAEEYGRYAERPDTYVLTNEDIKNGYVCMGKNKKVQVKSPLPDYEFSLLKSDIQPDVIESEGVAVVVGYTVLSEDGYVFKSTSNLNSISDKLEQNDNIKITNKDIDEGKKIIGYDNLGVPVILTFRAYKEGEMLENTTWAIGGLQQRNHALTGGYHGVELAFTTYAIKYAVKLGMLKDLGMYLLHRFGDVFAHFNMKNDVKEVDERNITPVSLNEYPNCLKSFFDSNLVVNVPRNESKQISLKEDGVYFINGKFYSTYDRIKTEKIIVESILTANSQIKRYTPISDDDLDKLVKKYEDNLDWIEIGLDFDGIVGYKYKIYRIKQSFRKIVTHSELHEFFLKLLENSKCKAIYNNNVMYGDQVTCKSNYTSGHSSDDTKPDDIIRRDKLFMRYVRCVSELYPMLSSSAKIVDGRDPVEVIRRVVDWGVEAAKVDENMLSAKLDGIFNFLIELEKGSGENSFSFSIPIKSLPEEIDTGLAWLMYSKVADKMHFFEWEFSKSANKQAKILRDYLDEMYKMYNITTQQFKKGIKVDVTSK